MQEPCRAGAAWSQHCHLLPFPLPPPTARPHDRGRGRLRTHAATQSSTQIATYSQPNIACSRHLKMSTGFTAGTQSCKTDICPHTTKNNRVIIADKLHTCQCTSAKGALRIMTAATMLKTPRTYIGRVKDPLQHHQDLLFRCRRFQMHSKKSKSMLHQESCTD